jgi:hypothetical protein
MAKFLSSGTLYGIAEIAYKRAKEMKNDYPEDTIVCIMFATAYSDGFLNDLVEYPDDFLPECIITLRKKWSDLSRIPLYLKYQIVKLTLSGEFYNEAKQPFKDFRLLIKLRNNIVHLKPERMKIKSEGKWEYKYPNYLKELEKRKLLKKDARSSWVNRIRTLEMAKWACRTALNITHSIIDAFPEGEFKVFLGSFCADRINELKKEP